MIEVKLPPRRAEASSIEPSGEIDSAFPRRPQLRAFQSRGQQDAGTNSTVKPMPFEEVDSIVNSYQNIPPKRSLKPTNAAKKPPPRLTAKTPGPRVEKYSPAAHNEHVTARPSHAIISPVGKTQPQTASGPAPTSPQLAANIVQPAFRLRSFE